MERDDVIAIQLTADKVGRRGDCGERNPFRKKRSFIRNVKTKEHKWKLEAIWASHFWKKLILYSPSLLISWSLTILPFPSQLHFLSRKSEQFVLTLNHGKWLNVIYENSHIFYLHIHHIFICANSLTFLMK